MLNITISGVGVMGGIFLKALAKNGDFKIIITDRSAEKLSAFGKKFPLVKINQDNAAAVSAADFIILAVINESLLLNI